MLRRFFSLFFIFLIHWLPAEEIPNEEDFIAKVIDDSELNTTLIDLTGMPSSIVGGAVNVITGNFFETESDLIMPCGSPLTLQRHYNSGSNDRGTLSHGWNLNLQSEITFFKKKKKRIALLKDRGANLLLDGSVSNSTVTMDVPKKAIRHGVTNCSAGMLSARSNLRMRELRYEFSRQQACQHACLRKWKRSSSIYPQGWKSF